jgi:NTP pyrophosphatase (non-canonical NTP hydrolase)
VREERLTEQARLAVQAQSYAASMKEKGRLRWLADDPDCPDVMRLAALTEEVGEVARAVHDGDVENLRAELVQVAGVALAWSVALS